VAVRIPLVELVSRATQGDDDAWRALFDHVEDVLEGYVGSPRFMGRLGQRVADRQNIIREVMERLRADSMQRLRLYLELQREQPNLDFESWVHVLARRVGNDYLARAKPAEEDAGASSESMRQAAEVVPEPALSALELWTLGSSYADIARELELDNASEAERLIRNALETLQRGAR
jgi:hypothetical protein